MADKTTTPKLSFDAFQGPLDAEEFADALVAIAEQIRGGITSGDGYGCGHWSVEGLKQGVTFDFRVANDGSVVVYGRIGDDADSEGIIFTSWDDSVETQTLMEDMAEKLNEGWDESYWIKRMEEHLTKLRLNRLGYNWTDDWDTGQQRWTLTGPDGAMRLPSGGFHGWSECVTVATRDAFVKDLPLQPEEDYQP